MKCEASIVTLFTNPMRWQHQHQQKLSPQVEGDLLFLPYHILLYHTVIRPKPHRFLLLCNKQQTTWKQGNTCTRKMQINKKCTVYMYIG